MRIPSGVTDQYIYFVAVDSTDFTTRETGLTTFTVYRSRNGAAAAAMTTPTINETDSTNMPGVYELLLDEDMTIGSGNDSEEMAFHITQASMAPVTRTIELYRPKITAGNTLGVAADGDISGNLDGTVATVTTLTGHTAQTGDSFARLGAPAGASVSADIATVDGNVDSILTDTGTTLQAELDAIQAAVITNAAGADIAADIIAMKAETALIVADTNELQTDNVPGLIATAQADLDTITGTDGVTLATAQALYAPSKAGDAMALTAGGVDDIWDELTSGHTTAGTTGKALTDAGAAGDPWSTALPGAYGAGTAGKIIGDNIDAPISTVDTVVDGIQTDLSNGTDGLGALKALIDTAQADLDIITDADGVVIGAAGVDLIWDEVLTGVTHNVTNSAGRRLRQIDAAFEVHNGTAQAGTANTITLDAGASAANDIYNGDRIVITEGTGAQEHGIVVDYDGTTKVATMAENWVVTPDATSVFEIVPADVDVETWQHNIVTASAGGLPDVNVNEVGDTAQTAGDLAALITTVDTVVDGIQTDLDNGTDGLGAIKSDTAAILTDTSTTIPATLGTPAGADMSTDIAAVKTDTAAILVDTGTTLDGKINTIDTNIDNLNLGIIYGAAATGTLSTTQATSDLTGYADDQLIGRVIVWTSGACEGEATDITDYANTTGLLTFTALTTAPANSDTFKIV